MSELNTVAPPLLLSTDHLTILNKRSNWKGLRQLSGHGAILLISGVLWTINLAEARWWLAFPALVLYGFSLAAMFAPMHESVHRTAFANLRLNASVAWWAGVLSFYNSTFYRRYHQWHHRYTRISGKDPESSDLEPTHLWQYILILSGLPWWWGKIYGHLRIAMGKFDDYPFIPAVARSEIMYSTQFQLAVYSFTVLVSAWAGHPWFVLYWLLPLAVGQPILRFILLAEHTGCTRDHNPLTNTRTTLTLWPLRFLLWNMPFHAEHHLYASIPFHALPQAHRLLRSHFVQVSDGYVQVNRDIMGQFGSIQQ
jgi:fatty acid desaturase